MITSQKDQKYGKLDDFAESTDVLGQTEYTKSIKTGFIQASQDISVLTGYIPSSIGHIFGRMGVGARTFPGHANAEEAFQWTTPTNDHAMMVNLLPVNPSDSGLATTQFIKLTSNFVGFKDLNSIVAPVQPSAAI